MLRSASIHRLLRNFDEVEDIFKRCVHIAHESEKAIVSQDGGAGMSERIFYWESQMLRHYLE